MWRNSDDGIDLWNTKGITLENNWAWENGYDDNLNPLGNGTGFKLGGSGSGDGGHTLKNNVSWGNKATGFNENAADIGITLYNNTAWDNGGKNYTFNREGSSAKHVLKNNIAFGTGVNISGISTNTYNSWNLPVVTVSSADFASLVDTCARGPRQANGSLPNCSFLHLASGSDLIDKGTNVGIAYTGSTPDLGAYEYGGTTPSDVTPPTVSITAPANGGTVSGAAVTVSGNASDNVGIAGVQFKLDGVNLGAEDTTNSYSLTWNSTTATNGTHTLTAVARDAAGNTTTSLVVSVSVNNDATPPTVSITHRPTAAPSRVQRSRFPRTPMTMSASQEYSSNSTTSISEPKTPLIRTRSHGTPPRRRTAPTPYLPSRGMRQAIAPHPRVSPSPSVTRHPAPT